MLYLFIYLCCCLPTPSCLLGESVSVVLWGFAASFSRQTFSRAARPEGSLHKSKLLMFCTPFIIDNCISFTVLPKHLVSLAYKLKLMLLLELTISLIKMLYKNIPRTHPWGTPDFTIYHIMFPVR